LDVGFLVDISTGFTQKTLASDG